MCFPPPVRYYAPLLVLVFGLATTWLDYEINVANDLARNYGDVAAQANVTGARLAKLAERQIEGGELAKFEDDLAAWADESRIPTSAGRAVRSRRHRWHRR